MKLLKSKQKFKDFAGLDNITKKQKKKNLIEWWNKS